MDPKEYRKAIKEYLEEEFNKMTDETSKKVIRNLIDNLTSKFDGQNKMEDGLRDLESKLKEEK